MPRKRTSRVYTRVRGGVTRYYGDFRDYADVGGRQEALIPKGGEAATTDPDIAQDIAARRVRDLERSRRKKQLTGVVQDEGLAKFAAYHLKEKKLAGKVEDSTLEYIELHLTRGVEFFGAATSLDAVSVGDVQNWVRWLRKIPNGRGGTLSDTNIRKHIDSMSNMYRRASADEVVLPGFNPFGAMMDRPSATTQEEAEWLEPHEVALFLEAVAHYRPRASKLHPIPGPEAEAIIATFALTGGREAEVLGLSGDDVSFDRKLIAYRPNEWRRLKTRTSHRPVRIWPQLEDILRGYLFSGDGPAGDLLFPSSRLGADEMIVDLRSMLDAVAWLCGWNPGEVRTKMFRHSYCAQRLQTADRVLRPGFEPTDPDAVMWVPVSQYTVGVELGHGGHSLVRKVYGHLGHVQHRAEVVEFRVDQHRKALRSQLALLQARAGQQHQQCQAIGWNGKRCKVPHKLSAEGLCIWHDPERAQEAKAARSRSQALQE